jgi:amidase
MRLFVAVAAPFFLLSNANAEALPKPADAFPPGIAEAQKLMTSGKATSEALVKLYLKRIATLNRKGIHLNAIIALNPHAAGDARALDAERRAGHVRGPLHGVPILLKDNIESDDGLATTAGSLALKDNVTHRDAPMTARLKAAGAVILGKTNLSEWANIRSSRSLSGWSGIGGLVANPYVLDRSPCGSSAGSGAAVAAGLAAGAIGTETNGSVVCPSSVNGLVGVKPTVGLVSRTHVVPISHSQDTPGPMTRTVEDAAVLLTALAGSDPEDPATADADLHKADYVRALHADALQGKRLGVLKPEFATHRLLAPIYAAALAKLKAAGAELVEVTLPETPTLDKNEGIVLGTELKADLNAYLATTAPAVKARTLADVIAFNDRTPREMAIFGQETFIRAEEKGKGLDDPAYVEALKAALTTARETLDHALEENHLDALVSLTTGAAWRTDAIIPNRGWGGVSTLPAIAGYPHITAPAGQLNGLPVGLSFIGPAWSDASLLAFAYAFQEQGARFMPPTFVKSIEDAPGIRAAFAPEQ